MGALKELLDDKAAPPPPAKHPTGWEPYVEQNGDKAVGISQPFATSPDERAIISAWDLDPDEWQIVGEMNVRRWQQEPGGDWLKYFKANLIRRLKSDRVDVDELLKIAERKKPAKSSAIILDNPAFVVSLNDWQIGKGEGGGTPATVDRIILAITNTRLRLKEMERLKRRPSRVILANTGDLVEAVSGHYPSQAFTVDLNGREQLRVARRLLFRFVDELVSDGYPVTVTAVPCNHGENRNASGKAQTTPDDNASLTIVEGIEEACAANPARYEFVDFAYAKDLTLVVDAAGVNLGLTHGHQVRGSGAGSTTIEKWWQGQIMGCQPIASADILLTAHRHHFQISEETGRTVILAPAMDGGSYWFTSATGKNSLPGMLTLTIGEGHARGWGDMHIC